MSSSRVHTTLTGTFAALATSAASRDEVRRSGWPGGRTLRRGTWCGGRTCSGLRPRTSAATRWSMVWNCVPVQTSHRSAVELDGAVERLHRGVGEVRHLRSPPRGASRRLPRPRPRRPSRARRCRRCGDSAADLGAQLLACPIPAPGPRSQSVFSAARPRLRRPGVGCHHRHATADLARPARRRGPSCAIGGVERSELRRRRPETAPRPRSRSPGNCTSMPNTALPVIFSGVSRRRIGLPISVHFSGGLSLTFVGVRERVRLARRAAPKEARRFPPMTYPFSDPAARRVGLPLARPRRGRAARGPSRRRCGTARTRSGGGRAAGHLDAEARVGVDRRGRRVLGADLRPVAARAPRR